MYIASNSSNRWRKKKKEWEGRKKTTVDIRLVCESKVFKWDILLDKILVEALKHYRMQLELWERKNALS